MFLLTRQFQASWIISARSTITAFAVQNFSSTCLNLLVATVHINFLTASLPLQLVPIIRVELIFIQRETESSYGHHIEFTTIGAYRITTILVIRRSVYTAVRL